MTRSHYTLWLSLLIFAVLQLQSTPIRADVRLPKVLSDHMVLQRDRPISIWGWASPGEEVTVSLAENSATSVTDADGNWSVKLPAMPAGGPHTLTVSGGNTITVQDVLLGEVWVCAGQSNMEFPYRSTQFAGRDAPKTDDPQLRLCTTPPVVAGRPQSDGPSSWAACSAGAVQNFSGVAYYFGKALREKIGVPVGLIHCSAGGTWIETWIPGSTCARVPSLAKIPRLVEQVNADYRKQQEKNLADWLTKARRAIADGNDPPPFAPIPPHIVQRGWLPTGIYNGAIHPLTRFRIRGVVWYQGEANNGEGMVYYDKLRNMISAWREAWGEGDFPFLFVQIAPWSGYPDGNVEGIWEAQRIALGAVPNTGMAVITDQVPNIADIHPNQKEEVGRRLALWALARTYGHEKLVCSGPLFKSATIEGDKIRVAFDHVGSGLATRDGNAPNFFQVGTPDGFEDADARIDGDTIVASSPKVPHPRYVRFAWNNTAQANLINKEGLPASPFRTDCPTVSFSTGSKFAGQKRIELITEPVAGVIRYTLDGSMPAETSTAYTRPFEINKTTTVRARLFAADGRSSLPTEATYTQVDPIVVDGKMLAPGLAFVCYSGKWLSLPDFAAIPATSRGVFDTLQPTEAANMNTQFAIQFKGYLDIPTAGNYTFTLKSDDGARFYLDGKLLIDDDGQHGVSPKSSDSIKLAAGKHPLLIQYHESWGASALSLWYSGPGINTQEVPSSAYFHIEQ